MRDLPQLHFDLLMLDIEMPGMNGKTIIKRVGKEHCIVVTGSKPRYEEVIKCHPIDILIKPATELHLQRALEKARIILAQPLRSKEYYAFQTAGSSDKINIKVKDIMYIVTDDDPRNKMVLMRDGNQHIFMNYTMIELLGAAPHLLQPNYSELVSMDIIAAKGYDHIHLKILNKDGKQKMVIIGRSFMEKFNSQFNGI